MSDTSAARTTPTESPVPTPRSHQPDRLGVPNRRHVDRSCVLCHRRKVRCDKRLPCTACVRGGRPCSYLDASEQLPRRRARKTTIADVASRVSDLEKSIVSSTTPTVERFTPSRSSTSWLSADLRPKPSTSLRGVQSRSEAPNEILVQNGSSSQYVNEIVVSRMIEADGDRNSLLSTPQVTSPDQTQRSPFSLMGILSHPSSYAQEPESNLDKLCGMKLWQIFVANVDSFVKVLHIPTAEVDIFTAINQPEVISKDIMALLQAVYFAAVTSMESEDVLKMLGVDQLSALALFKGRFQRALAEADLLENPTVTLLQALAIYLHIVPTWNSSRGAWILNGLALRVALSIGLHTDGSKLGLPPFESELRRRVWWHIFARDFRSLEDHGISPLLHLPKYCTRMPLNVEDCDLQPEMEELPRERLGWTRMTFPLVNLEISNAFHETFPSAEASFKPGERMALRDETFRLLKSKLDGYFSSCHPAVPLQKFTLRIGQAIVHKLDLVTRQQVANMETPNDRDSFATEENLDSACTCLEMNLDVWHDELLRPHRWSQRVHPQYHLVLYVLWHLCIRPEGPQVDRAWELVDAMFRVEAQRLAHDTSGPSLKSAVLQRLRRRAEIVRESVMNGNHPREDQGDQAAEASAVQPGLETDAGDSASGLDMGSDTDWTSAVDGLPLPDWNTVLGDLQVDLHNFPGMLYTVPL